MNYMGIKPLIGINYNGCNIELGYTKSKVIELLGTGDEKGSSIHYFDNQLRIDFQTEQVHIIEFTAGSNAIEPMIFDLKPLAENAELVLKIIMENCQGEYTTENDCTYHFPKIGITISREYTPDMVKELVVEAKSKGKLDINQLQILSQKANHWSKITISK